MHLSMSSRSGSAVLFERTICPLVLGCPRPDGGGLVDLAHGQGGKWGRPVVVPLCELVYALPGHAEVLGDLLGTPQLHDRSPFRRTRLTIDKRGLDDRQVALHYEVDTTSSSWRYAKNHHPYEGPRCAIRGTAYRWIVAPAAAPAQTLLPVRRGLPPHRPAGHREPRMSV